MSKKSSTTAGRVQRPSRPAGSHDWSRQDQAKLDEDSQALLEQKGTKANAISAEAFNAFRERTKGVYESFRSEIGPEFMDESLAFIKSVRGK